VGAGAQDLAGFIHPRRRLVTRDGVPMLGGAACDSVELEEGESPFSVTWTQSVAQSMSNYYELLGSHIGWD
jgi:hypothetical protein